jgi:hypothetical protein
VSFTVREYVDERGQIPFRDWLVGLDIATRARVQARILRQTKDIQSAKVFWADYLKEMRDGKTR